MTSLLTKIEQDDEILKELDNKLRTSSRRTFIDDDNLAEPGEKSSSLPSLNSFGGSEWKKATKNDHETSYESYRKDSGALLPLLLIGNQLLTIGSAFLQGTTTTLPAIKRLPMN